MIEFKGSWDTHLSLMEFVYNNSYQSSISMAPFEALYGRKCRTPVCWDEVGERRLTGPELVQITLDTETDSRQPGTDRKVMRTNAVGIYSLRWATGSSSKFPPRKVSSDLEEAES